MAQGSATDPSKAAEALNLGRAGYSSGQIEQMTGIPGRTIRDIVSGHGRWGATMQDNPVFAELRREQNTVLEAAFRAAAAQSLAEAYRQEKLDKASHYQLVIAASIAIDKARLLAGEAGQIVEHQISRAALTDEDDLLARLAASIIDVTPDAASPASLEQEQ